MASRPVVPLPCSTFSRPWKPPASNSSARRQMGLEFEFVTHQHVANEEIACSGPPSSKRCLRQAHQKWRWTKEQIMNIVERER